MRRSESAPTGETTAQLPKGVALVRPVPSQHGTLTDFEWCWTNPTVPLLLDPGEPLVAGARLRRPFPALFQICRQVFETAEPAELRLELAHGRPGALTIQVTPAGDGVALVLEAEDGSIAAKLDQQLRGWRRAEAANETLRSNEEALRASERQKDEFLAMLSHELRNPLAAIRSACALLESIDSPDPMLDRIQTILARQTSHMAHLLDELLDLARVTNGKLTIVPNLVDLSGLTREVIADLELITNGPTLTVSLPNAPVWVDGDPVRLAQVVHNLLSNALKYTAADGWVRLSLVERNGAALLSVRDNGVGLDEEFAQHLFEPFHQAAQDIARSAGGLGLGLALSKTIVELHAGSIVAHSPGRGRGSCFEVALPLTERAPPALPEPLRAVTKTARVMIIEDNEDAAELLAALLRARAFEVELATRGEQALALIRSWRPDAILCDIGLPDIDGYTVARTIRANPAFAAIKLVALSGYGQAKDRLRAAEAGFDHHLTKPATIDAVVRAIA
jgi:two-component system, chemotaxis family, CheB/CheR fusion protein